MNELQIKENITTLELLEQINFFRNDIEGKKPILHKNLLQVVRDEFEEEINELKIQPVEYKDKKGESRPMFNLTLSQAKQVLVRESKAVRKAVIKYIEELEEKIKNNGLPTTYKEALLELVKREEEKEQLQLTIKLQEHKVIFSDAVNASEDSILVRDLAKLICQNGVSIGQNRLFEWLRNNGYLIKRGESKNLPTQKYIDNGIFKLKETTVNSPEGSKIRITPKVTGKGQIYFINKFLKGKNRGLEVI